jgi:hypothetical protein
MFSDLSQILEQDRAFYDGSFGPIRQDARQGMLFNILEPPPGYQQGIEHYFYWQPHEK